MSGSLRPRSGLIATAVEDSGDQDIPIVSIVDDVVFNGERSDAHAELGSQTTDSRLFGQQLESFDDGVNESIGGSRAGILGDIGPDLVEVLLGESGQPIRHLRLFAASRTTARLDSLGELPT